MSEVLKLESRLVFALILGVLDWCRILKFAVNQLIKHWYSRLSDGCSFGIWNFAEQTKKMSVERVERCDWLARKEGNVRWRRSIHK